MAIAAKTPGTRVQSWLPVELAADLKHYAEAERRSISSVVRPIKIPTFEIG
jgi:hypothetical protein